MQLLNWKSNQETHFKLHLFIQSWFNNLISQELRSLNREQGCHETKEQEPIFYNTPPLCVSSGGVSVALSVWEGKETWTGVERGVRFEHRLLWWWRQKKEHVGILLSSKVIFKVLSGFFSGLSASQVWALNLILRPYESVSVAKSCCVFSEFATRGCCGNWHCGNWHAAMSALEKVKPSGRGYPKDPNCATAQKISVPLHGICKRRLCFADFSPCLVSMGSVVTMGMPWWEQEAP